ncbi:uncharacterized protein A4U43_C01F15860 [Asparagus officinalis]|uniref:Uncharacterized protein n=1 Tax=Asparagus officinalis TaxID=4686 RepID=A0A5P1FS67_ASPOF|nr:uncharacterized protein A4U43_C01F15860 [Asparagus officinalis]
MSTHLQGKEPVAEGVSIHEEYGWSYPYRVDEIDSKIWDRLQMLLIRSPKVGSRYEKELTLDNRH